MLHAALKCLCHLVNIIKIIHNSLDFGLRLGGRPSVDDFAVRSWASKQRSPRSLSSSEPSTGWNENLPAQPRRSIVDLSQSGGGENRIPAHPWQQYSRMTRGYPPGLTMRENWREQRPPRAAIQRSTNYCSD